MDAGSQTGTWFNEGATNDKEERRGARRAIVRANANVTINPYSGTYDAAAHNLTGSVVGVAGDLAALGSSLTFGATFRSDDHQTETQTLLNLVCHLDLSENTAITIAHANANVTIKPYSGN